MPDIEPLHRTAYDAGADPIEWAVQQIAQHLEARDEIAAGRAVDPGAFPGFSLDLDATSTGRRAIAALLDAGWSPPTTTREDPTMTTTEWQEFRKAADDLVGRQVRITFINGHKVTGHLTGVGYEGLRVLQPGVDHETHYPARIIATVAPYSRPPATGERPA